MAASGQDKAEASQLDVGCGDGCLPVRSQSRAQEENAPSLRSRIRDFYKRIGNKPIKEITRGDLIRFAAWLREEKGQAARSCW